MVEITFVATVYASAKFRIKIVGLDLLDRAGVEKVGRMTIVSRVICGCQQVASTGWSLTE